MSVVMGHVSKGRARSFNSGNIPKPPRVCAEGRRKRPKSAFPRPARVAPGKKNAVCVLPVTSHRQGNRYLLQRWMSDKQPASSASHWASFLPACWCSTRLPGIESLWPSIDETGKAGHHDPFGRDVGPDVAERLHLVHEILEPRARDRVITREIVDLAQVIVAARHG